MATRRSVSPTVHRPRRAITVACVALGLLGPPLVGVLAPSPASAGGANTQIVVTTTDDVVNPADGVVSLREAVDEANADGVGNDIVLEEAETYVLDQCGGGTDENNNVGGDLDHTEDQDLRIYGGHSTIQQSCPNERVLHLWVPGPSVQLWEVRITGGRTAGPGGGVMAGGAISLVRAVVDGNVSGHVNGGGGVAANLDAYVYNSTIRDNAAAGRGGGIRSNDELVVTHSTIEGNSSGASGGGLSAGSYGEVVNTTITGNRASVSGGGASTNGDDLDLEGVTIVANRAPTGANAHADGAILLHGTVIGLGSQGDDCASWTGVDNDGANVGYDASCGAAGTDDLPELHPMVGLLRPGPAGTSSLDPARDSMPPSIGSPVVDRYGAPCVYVIDQHLVNRPQGAACDSGSVEATPAPCAPTFTDVGAAHPFFEEICWLADSGITGGYQDGSFGAGQPVSRQAMAAFLYRLALAPPPPALPPTFDDVPTDHPFALEIGWLADEGISEGYDDGTFRPGDAVTRQAMAAFLNRVAGEPIIAIVAGSQSFSDVSPEHPFYGAIEWMAQAGVSEGYADGTWQPAAPVTRQAMAAFLQRMAEGVVLAGL
jgi:hypothetical protein